MSASKPKLVTVETPPVDQSTVASPRASRPDRRIQIALIIAVIVATAAAAVAVWQTQRADLLSVQVEGLEVELGEAQAALGVYEHRFGEIRASVGDLRAQFGQLEALVETPPAFPAAP